MSHHRIKTKYQEDTGYNFEERTLYMDINNSCDIVTISNDDGRVIWCYSEGSNNFEDAIIRLINHIKEPSDKVEYWDQEDMRLHKKLK